jgi:hypothetical protein
MTTLIVAFCNFAKVSKNRCQNLIKIINKCSTNYCEYITTILYPNTFTSNCCAVVEINTANYLNTRTVIILNTHLFCLTAFIVILTIHHTKGINLGIDIDILVNRHRVATRW